MERWLTQRLSTRLGAAHGRADGVCANVAFPSPRRLVGDAVAAASGIDPETDPWLAERIVWPLLEVIEEALERALAARARRAPRRGHGRPDEARRARRLSSVRHIAELFDRYARHRPAMLLRVGERREPTPGVDRADARWQPELWRRLRERVGVPGSREPPRRRLPAGCARSPGSSTCPRACRSSASPACRRRRSRCSARSPPRRDVHLFALHPSPVLWADVAAAAAASSGRHAPRATTRPRTSPSNRLLASWGQDARELQLVAARRRRAAARTTTIPSRTRERHAARAHPGRRARRPRRRPGASATRSTPATAASRSTPATAAAARSRSCAARSCTLLARGPDARAARRHRHVPRHRDVRAAHPGDVRRRAGRRRRGRPAARRRPAARPARAPRRPLAAPDQPGPRRRQRAARARGRAGRRLRRCSTSPTARPSAGASASTTTTSRGSRTGSRRAGIRWGLDAEHRRPFKLDALDAGTWRAGLDRVLLGVTTSETLRRRRARARRRRQRRDRPRRAPRRARRPPHRDARRAQHAAADRRAGRRASRPAADALTATTPGDAWQRAELQRLLDDVVAGATAAARSTRRCSSRRRSARCSPSASPAARRARTSAPAT